MINTSVVYDIPGQKPQSYSVYLLVIAVLTLTFVLIVTYNEDCECSLCGPGALLQNDLAGLYWSD